MEQLCLPYNISAARSKLSRAVPVLTDGLWLDLSVILWLLGGGGDDDDDDDDDMLLLLVVLL